MLERNVGAYTVTVSNSAGTATSPAASLRLATNLHATLYADDFDIDSSNEWKPFWGAQNNQPDYTADWAFDYSNVSRSFNGSVILIPPAPNTAAGTHRALRMTVNQNDATAATTGLSVYPANQSFSNDYALKFDMWLHYPGTAGGLVATGSTQHATFGLNHAGIRANWAAPSGTASDGVWFAVDGEGGDPSRDYRAYVGNPSSVPTELIGPAASGLGESNSAAQFFTNLLPAVNYESPGAPGKTWVEVELRQTNQVLTWLLNGTVIAQRANSSSFTRGNIMLGLMDIFTSIANPPEESFVLFDNVRVEDLHDQIRFLSFQKQTNGTIDMLVSAVPLHHYEIQASTNLVDWTVLSTTNAGRAPIRFTATITNVPGAHFFRVHEN